MIRRLTLLSVLVCLLGSTLRSVEAQTLAHYRFEEGEGTDVVDSESGAIDGTLTEGSAFSDDVPCLSGNLDNQFSADFTTGGFALMDGTSFILHAADAGGAEGDATLEWFMKLPAGQPHSSIFWTNSDDGADSNRFNIFWNASFTGAAGSDTFVSGDYKDPAGAGPQAISPHDNGLPIVVGAWHHFAIVRTEQEDGSYLWTWFVDGVESAGHSAVTSLDLPNATSWSICGRQGAPALRALIDEVRLTEGALEPGDFLICPRVECPDEGDTHCDGLSADPPGGAAGQYEITADASDDSGDSILYTFQADDSAGSVLVVGPQQDNTATFNLGIGTWTVSVTVDDDPFCDDAAGDASCEIVVDVTEGFESSPRFLRFEEGEGTDIVDSDSGEIVGELVGGATFSEDTPCLINGEENRFSADFTQGGFAKITDAVFLLHDPAVGGAENATLEWFMKVPNSHAHASIFWTNGDDALDSNRFNIFWNAEFTGQPGSDRFVSADYRAPDSSGPVPISPHGNGLAISLDAWHHFAIVRTANGDGTYEWRWFVDGAESPGHGPTTAGLTLPDSLSWEICGRGGGQALRALIDEVRLTPEALGPEDFLGCESDCPVEGDADFADTSCAGLESSPAGGAPGEYTFTADASDGTGDAISYSFSANNGIDPPLSVSTDESSATMFLTQGVWTVTVTVDDDPDCNDAAGDAACVIEVVVEGDIEPGDFTPLAYYRFEEGQGTDVVDELSGAVDGQLLDGAGFSEDTATPHVPQTGAPNDFSADFSEAGFALMEGTSFILHSPAAGGAEGDATFEFLLKVPVAQDHNAIFWTNGEPADVNRFNIFWNASFTGAPDSDRFLSADYRGENGEGPDAIGEHGIGTPLTLGEWHHVAIVRRQLAEGVYQWRWYVDGELDAGKGRNTTLALPTATTWLLAGRQGAAGIRCLIDEVRLSEGALVPSQFLISPGDAVDEDCSNVIDDDGDGLIDCDDPDCEATNECEDTFVRGDTNSSGAIDLTDGIATLNFLFVGGSAPACFDAADTDDSGSLAINDAVITFSYLFTGGAAPSPPSPTMSAYPPSDCGRDETFDDFFCGRLAETCSSAP